MHLGDTTDTVLNTTAAGAQFIPGVGTILGIGTKLVDIGYQLFVEGPQAQASVKQTNQLASAWGPYGQRLQDSNAVFTMPVTGTKISTNMILLAGAGLLAVIFILKR